MHPDHVVVIGLPLRRSAPGLALGLDLLAELARRHGGAAGAGAVAAAGTLGLGELFRVLLQPGRHARPQAGALGNLLQQRAPLAPAARQVGRQPHDQARDQDHVTLGQLRGREEAAVRAVVGDALAALMPARRARARARAPGGLDTLLVVPEHLRDLVEQVSGQGLQPEQRQDPEARLGAGAGPDRRPRRRAHAAGEGTDSPADGSTRQHRAAVVEGDVLAQRDQDVPDGREVDRGEHLGDPALRQRSDRWTSLAAEMGDWRKTPQFASYLANRGASRNRRIRSIGICILSSEFLIRVLFLIVLFKLLPGRI